MLEKLVACWKGTSELDCEVCELQTGNWRHVCNLEEFGRAHSPLVGIRAMAIVTSDVVNCFVGKSPKQRVALDDIN